jgi:O-antigen ligase/transposase
MRIKVPRKFLNFSESFTIRMAFVVLGVCASILGGYLVSVQGSLALKIAGALLVAIIVLRFPFAGLLLFVGMIPLESAFLSIGNGAATYTLLLGIYLFALWGLKLMREHQPIAVMPYAKWLLPFLAWAAVSNLWAADHLLSFQYLLTLIQMFGLGLLMYNQVNSRKSLNLILSVLLASSIVVVILGYFQAKILTGHALLRLLSQSTKDYASIVGLAFLSGIILYFFGDKKRFGLLLLIVPVISLYPLFAASERGIFLALLLALLALLLITKHKLAYSAYAGLAVLGLYGIFLLITRLGWLSNFAISRLSITSIIETGGSGRTEIWKVGWQIIQDNPLIGVGLGNFTTAFYKYVTYVAPSINSTGSGPHNDLLGVLAETGGIGLVLFIGLLGSLGMRLLQLFRKLPAQGMRVVSAWVLSLFVYCFSVGLTSVFMYRKLYWLAIILVEVVINVSQNNYEDITPSFKKESETATWHEMGRAKENDIEWIGERKSLEEPFSYYPKAPLRELSEEERVWLERIRCSQSEPAAQVIRAKEILLVAEGHTFSAAARLAGRKSGGAVAKLVKRFNQEGLNAIMSDHRGRLKENYGDDERERILMEVRRKPEPEKDGTANWTLKTVCEALQKAPDGLPEVSENTVHTVLLEAGFSWQRPGGWTETGNVVRKRKRGKLIVADPNSTNMNYEKASVSKEKEEKVG